MNQIPMPCLEVPINITMAKIPNSTTFMDKSCSVLRVDLLLAPALSPLIASLKVVNIKGNDLIRLNIPPKATAPAPNTIS
ncbi:MAG: hypothetical protein ACFWUA_02845 [Sporanaerobacter sp.]|jgi:hypothetical protein|uniref:hypothetical protein n=1 Tax=Sporanaerobacter sp. TaxID=2010183 RepID=UPI003A1021BA